MLCLAGPWLCCLCFSGALWLNSSLTNLKRLVHSLDSRWLSKEHHWSLKPRRKFTWAYIEVALEVKCLTVICPQHAAKNRPLELFPSVCIVVNPDSNTKCDPGRLLVALMVQMEFGAS